MDTNKNEFIREEIIARLNMPYDLRKDLLEHSTNKLIQRCRDQSNDDLTKYFLSVLLYINQNYPDFILNI